MSDRMFPGGFGMIVIALAVVVLAGMWAVLAGGRLIGGPSTDRPQRVPQLYGYTVCLIALLWALTSVATLADNVLSLSAPDIRTEFGFEPSVTSFEAFRSTYDQSRRMAGPYPPTVQLDSVPEPELRKRYEALREDRIRRGKFMAQKSIVTSSLSLVIAAALFAFHWRWLRRNQPTTA